LSAISLEVTFNSLLRDFCDDFYYTALHMTKISSSPLPTVIIQSVWHTYSTNTQAAWEQNWSLQMWGKVSLLTVSHLIS